MADVAALVKGVRNGVLATRSMDQAKREAAEAQFHQLSRTQYPRLIYALGEIMKDNSVPTDDPVRQQASVLIQQYIKPRDPRLVPVYAKLWMDQNDAFKAQVRTTHASCIVVPKLVQRATRNGSSLHSIPLPPPPKIWWAEPNLAMC